MFYIYNTIKGRHNSLEMRYNVSLDDPRLLNNSMLDPQFVRLHMFWNSSDSIGIMFTLNNVTRLYYEFYPWTQLLLNETNIDELNQRCKETDKLEIKLAVYPEDNTD